jgi:hypothetical protein
VTPDTPVTVTYRFDHPVTAEYQVGSAVAICRRDQPLESAFARRLPPSTIKEDDSPTVVVVLHAAALEQ